MVVSELCRTGSVERLPVVPDLREVRKMAVRKSPIRQANPHLGNKDPAAVPYCRL